MSKGERAAFIASSVAVLISGLWFYIQLLAWKAEGHDYRLTATNIIVTILLWAVLIWAAWRNFRDARRADRLNAALVTARDDNRTKIAAIEREHSNEINRLNVDCADKLEKRRLTLFEELQAKYPTTEPVEQELREATAENRRLAAEAREDREEIAKLKALINSLKSSEERKRLDGPNLWIDYRPEGGASPHAERLVFSTDKGAAIKIEEVRPLVWKSVEQYPITLFNVIGIVRDDPVECAFTTFKQVERTQQLWRLPELYRDMMRKYGVDVQPTIEVLYSDMKGNTFARRFILSIDPSNRIVWEPMMLSKQASEGI